MKKSMLFFFLSFVLLYSEVSFSEVADQMAKGQDTRSTAFLNDCELQCVKKYRLCLMQNENVQAKCSKAIDQCLTECDEAAIKEAEKAKQEAEGDDDHSNYYN